VFIRRIFESEYTACVTSKLCLEGIGKIVPDLQVNRSGVSAGEKSGARKERNTYGDTLVLATAVYVVVARSDTEY
jgi:hypothetical protein